MEKGTVTIEIKQEVSITLLWIVAGVVVVSLAFLLTPQSTELWPSINAAGIAAGLYGIALLTFVLRKPLGTKLRLWISIAALASMGLMAFTWVRAQEQTHWQAETLMPIRGIIGRGVMRYDMSTALLKTLDEFYKQGPTKKETLAAIFSRLQNGAMAGSDIHKSSWPGDSLKVIVKTLEPGRIELVSQETYVKGRDPQFMNHNGQIGMIQETFILTEKGISHVSEN